MSEYKSIMIVVGLISLLGLILFGFQLVYTSGYNSGYLDACVDAKKGIEPLYVLVETESMERAWQKNKNYGK